VAQRAVNSFGTIFIAGIAAPWRLYGLFDIIGGAAEGSIAIFVGHNHGAGKDGRAREGVRAAAVGLIAASVLLSLATLAFGGKMLGALVSGSQADEVLETGKIQLAFMAATLPFLYILFLFRAALDGIGHVRASLASGLTEMAARVLCSLLLPPIFGRWGIYVAQVAGWPAAAALLSAAYFSAARKMGGRRFQPAGQTTDGG
jgi:Na+-driven multidrug efflux pump